MHTMLVADSGLSRYSFTMPVTYTNRKGQIYFLHTGVTKAGKPRLFMSSKKGGPLAEAIPEGYELWEKPENAQVFIRRILRTQITPEEQTLVRTLARTKAKTRYTIVDVTAKEIIVYAADDDDVETGLNLVGALGDARSARARLFMERYLRYEAMVRFTLKDAAGRMFLAERWCFRGSIDAWIPLGSGQLGELAAEYIPHVGSESFFELM